MLNLLCWFNSSLSKLRVPPPFELSPPCDADHFGFLRVAFNPTSLHHLLTRLSAFCARLDTVLASLARTTTARSPAYPCAYMSALLSRSSSSSTTRHHSSGEITPTCGHPRPTEAVTVPSPLVTVSWWVESMFLIHRVMVTPSPCLSAALQIASTVVNLKASSMSRKSPTAMHPLFLASSSLYTSL